MIFRFQYTTPRRETQDGRMPQKRSRHRLFCSIPSLLQSDCFCGTMSVKYKYFSGGIVMFENVGRKIQGLAKAVAILGIVISVFVGLFYLMETPSGLLIMLLGSLSSWIGSFTTYGFGVLVEHAEVSLGRSAPPTGYVPSAGFAQRPYYAPNTTQAPLGNDPHYGEQNPVRNQAQTASVKFEQPGQHIDNIPRAPQTPGWTCPHCGNRTPFWMTRCQTCGRG